MRLFSRPARQKPEPSEPKSLPASLFPRHLEVEENPEMHAERIAKNQFGDRFYRYDLGVRRTSKNTKNQQITREALEKIKTAIEGYTPGSKPCLIDLLSLSNQYIKHQTEFNLDTKMLITISQIAACALEKLESMKDEPEILQGLNSGRLVEKQIASIHENLARVLNNHLI